MPITLREPSFLAAWDKIELLPAETKTVTLTIDPLYLSIFNADKDQWEAPPGEYVIFVGGSSRSTPVQEAGRRNYAALVRRVMVWHMSAFCVSMP